MCDQYISFFFRAHLRPNSVPCHYGPQLYASPAKTALATTYNGNSNGVQNGAHVSGGANATSNTTVGSRATQLKSTYTTVTTSQVEL